MTLKIITTAQIEPYLLLIDPQLAIQLNGLEDAALSSDTFSFHTSVASVFSSKIEGENIELDSYIKHKKFGAEYLPDYTKKLTIFMMLTRLQKLTHLIKKTSVKHIDY